jgi:hypothetical protein
MLIAIHADLETEGMKMKINSKDFRVRPGTKVALGAWPTIVKPFCRSKKRYRELLGEHVEELSELQCLHYASNRYALLLIFQGMDAAESTVPFGTSCPGSSRKVARFSASNSRVPRNWRTIFFGARPAVCRNAGGSAFSIVPTTLTVA